MTVLAQIHRRAATDAAFGAEVRTALASGGIVAAAGVARSHGFDVPAFSAGSDELSDLELELVSGGKGVGEGMAAVGTGIAGALFGG